MCVCVSHKPSGLALTGPVGLGPKYGPGDPEAPQSAQWHDSGSRGDRTGE